MTVACVSGTCNVVRLNGCRSFGDHAHLECVIFDSPEIKFSRKFRWGLFGTCQLGTGYKLDRSLLEWVK